MNDSPVFPPELEREIFETTAELYPETIYKPCLLLVAKRVNEWIERIKYRAVTSAEPTRACPLRLLQKVLSSNSKPAEFFHDRVRRLFIGPAVPEEELPPILSACTGVRSLALLNFPGLLILQSLAVIQPRRLVTNGARSESVDLAHPAFTCVTHLQSIINYSLSKDLPGADFALLPALTHLALWQLSEDSATGLLSNCAKLEVLVDMRGAMARENLPSIDDARFLYASTSHDDVLDWVIGTRDGVDFWVRAERFVAKRRRGEIKPSSRCWIEDGDGI